VSDEPLDVAAVWNRAGSRLGGARLVRFDPGSDDAAVRFTSCHDDGGSMASAISLVLVSTAAANAMTSASVPPNRPAEFAACVADDLAKWARLAKEAGLKAE
jgi:hypothetical protein